MRVQLPAALRIADLQSALWLWGLPKSAECNSAIQKDGGVRVAVGAVAL